MMPGHAIPNPDSERPVITDNCQSAATQGF